MRAESAKPAPYRRGIDLGGTKIEGIVLDPSGKEIFRKRVATEQDAGWLHILDQIYSLYQDLNQKILEKSHTLGIGTPGAVSPRTGLLKNSNTVCLNGKPVVEELRKRFGRPFSIQNDANCFAMAEALHGAGKSHELVFGVILGTGCGGGIVYRGQILEGHQRIAGEWGHMTIDPNGPECYCGRNGCVETFISGGGLERLYHKQFGAKKSFPEILKGSQINPKDHDFIAQFYRNFGRSLANLINILDPDIIVLGGGVSNVDGLYREGMAEVRNYVFNDSLLTPIVKHQLGDSAGVIGAALLGC